MTPFEEALSSEEKTFFKVSLAWSNFFSDKRRLNSFITVFISEVTLIFLRCFFLDFLISLYADLFCGMVPVIYHR